MALMILEMMIIVIVDFLEKSGGLNPPPECGAKTDRYFYYTENATMTNYNIQQLVGRLVPACLERHKRTEEPNSDFLSLLQQYILHNLHLYHPRHWCLLWLWRFDHPRRFWLWLWLIFL